MKVEMFILVPKIWIGREMKRRRNNGGLVPHYGTQNSVFLKCYDKCGMSSPKTITNYTSGWSQHLVDV